MNLQSLVPIAVVFIIAAFIFGISGQLLDGVQESTCSGTWIAVGDGAAANLGGNNPSHGGNWGCCTTAAAANNCTTWDTGYAQNATYEGQDAVIELSSWLPTLALVIIAAIIIGVLVMYLAGRRR